MKNQHADVGSMPTSRHHAAKRTSYLIALAGLVAVGMMSGCASTKQARKAVPSGFLKPEAYSLMKKTKGEHAQLVYVNFDTDWKKYKNVMIEPVTIWRVPGSELEALPKEDLNMIGAFVYNAMRAELSKDYTIVDKPGPATLKIRAAITQADKSVAALDMFTTVFPVGLAISEVKELATGTGSFVGKAAAESEIRDAQTGELLAAGVMARVGQKAINTSKVSSWGDVKSAVEVWAERLRMNLEKARKGELQVELAP